MSNIKVCKKDKGITLIALVITIVILLILAGISIATLGGDNGLFKRAQNAKKNTLDAQIAENAAIDSYNATIDSVLGETTTGGDTLASKVTDGTIKVGDYVKYAPTKATSDAIVAELGAYSGSNTNTTSTLTQENLNWRVLDVKNGEVRLISEKPTTSTIELSGAKGYNNAVYLLDKTASTLYSNTKYAKNVQNLKIEDIQEYMNETDYTKINSDYEKFINPIDSKNYPNLYAQEKNRGIGGTQKTTGLNLSEQTTPLNEESTEASALGATYTYWYKSMVNTDFKDAKYYEMFINNGTNYPTYWMSSRCVDAYSVNAHFYVRRVNSGNVDARNLYNSNDVSYSNAYVFRPIITLNSGVQVNATETTKDGSNADNAYELK